MSRELAAAATRRDVPTWRERWLNFRNSLIANPRFQNWSADFPLTRPVARKRARAVFDLVAGFVYSQTLLACIELKLFNILAEGAVSALGLAPRIGLTVDATTRLLKGARAIGLTESLPDGRFGLGQLGAALLGNPSIVAMIEHHRLLYADLANPVALLRGERQNSHLKTFWTYAKISNAAESSAEQVHAYSKLMAESQQMIAGMALDAYSLAHHTRLLDIGGGDGAFLSEVGRRYDRLDLVLFDLPAVSALAMDRFSRAGLAARASVVGGDFFKDPLPVGADVASLVRVLHDHDDDLALAILRKAHAALPSGGTLLIVEPMSGIPGALPIGDTYFGLYLAAMGSGRTRTFHEIRGLLAQAGFGRPRFVPSRMPMLAGIVTAVA